MLRQQPALDCHSRWQYTSRKPFFTFLAAFAYLLASLGSASTSVRAQEGFITAGTSAGIKNLNSYQAIIYTPFGTLSESGLILRGWTKAFRFAYKTDLPSANNVTITALGLSVEAEAGWQFTFDQARIAVYAGAVWRKHTLSPLDPNSTLARSRFGISATVDGEYRFTSDYGVMANANFLQGFNQYWVQIKPYMKLSDGWKIGLDVASAGGKDYNISRIGVFASDYAFSVWGNKPIYIGGEAGVKFSFKDNKTTPYLGLNVGYLF